MKRHLLFAGLAASTIMNAQNVDNQKIQFSYIQLPSAPIEGTLTYQIESDHSKYEAANDDSLDAYEVRINQAQTNLELWMESKKKTDQAHLLEMAKWQKAVNGGAVIPEPKKQAYIGMPLLKEELPEPILTTEVSEGTVGGGVNLAGFTKSADGATISITFLGLQDAKVEFKKTGTGATTKYQYTAKYKYPANYIIKSPTAGVVASGSVNMTVKSKTINSYASQYDYEYWKTDNLGEFWKTMQTAEVQSVVNTVNAKANDLCGFPVKSYSTEVFTVKKYKEHNYSDLIDAYSHANDGYDKIYLKKDMSDAKSDIQKAVAIWESALSESNLSDKKSRINDKVTALLYVNLAEAYMWMGDFSKASNYSNKAKSAGVMKYKNKAKKLDTFMAELKRRYTANY